MGASWLRQDDEDNNSAKASQGSGPQLQSWSPGDGLGKLVVLVASLAAVIGVALSFEWLEARIFGDGIEDEIPEKVWEGGGGMLTVELTLDQPGFIAMDFGRQRRRGEDFLEAQQELSAGTHVFNIELPAGTAVTLEAGLAEGTPPGGQATWTIWSGDQELHRGSLPAEQPGETLFHEVSDAAAGGFGSGE